MKSLDTSAIEARLPKPPAHRSSLREGEAVTSGSPEGPRVLFLGMCLILNYLVIWLMFPKRGLHLGRRTVAKALMNP